MVFARSATFQAVLAERLILKREWQILSVVGDRAPDPDPEDGAAEVSLGGLARLERRADVEVRREMPDPAPFGGEPLRSTIGGAA